MKTKKFKNTLSTLGIQFDLIREDDGTYSFIGYDGKNQDHIGPEAELDTFTLIPSLMKGLGPEALSIANGKGNPQEANHLYLRIHQFIGDYFVFTDPNDLKFFSLYCLATWSFDEYSYISYISLTGLPGSGKSRALLAAKEVCYLSYFASGADTEAAFIRVLSSLDGTCVMDEAQRAVNDSKSVYHQTLALGNHKGGAITKTVSKKDVFEIERLGVFGPKIFGGRHSFGEEAIRSRTMELKLEKPQTPKFKHEVFLDDRVADLRNDLLLYRQRRKLEELKAPGEKYSSDFQSEQFTPREKQVYDWLAREAPTDDCYESLIKTIKKQRDLSQTILVSRDDVQLLSFLWNAIKKRTSTDLNSRIMIKHLSDLMKDDQDKFISIKWVSRTLRDFGFTVRRFSEGMAVVCSRTEVAQILHRLGVQRESYDADTIE